MPMLTWRAWERVWCLKIVGSEASNWTGSHDDNYHCQHGVAQHALLLDCRMDRRVILVRLPTRKKYFLWSKSVQTSCGTIPALYSIGTWLLLPSGVQLTQKLLIKPRIRTTVDIHRYHPYASMTCMGISIIKVIHNPWAWVIMICCRLA